MLEKSHSEAIKSEASKIDVGITDVAVAPIDLAAAYDFVSDPVYGGINTFVGIVRDFNEGRDVRGISYDIFPAMANKRLKQIAEEAQAKYGDARIYIRHAHGRLTVGDIAVVVAVGTRHRDEAFKACRDVIEAVKYTAPVWKQEHYVDGDSAWTEGAALSPTDQASD